MAAFYQMEIHPCKHYKTLDPVVNGWGVGVGGMQTLQSVLLSKVG